MDRVTRGPRHPAQLEAVALDGLITRELQKDQNGWMIDLPISSHDEIILVFSYFMKMGQDQIARYVAIYRWATERPR